MRSFSLAADPTADLVMLTREEMELVQCLAEILMREALEQRDALARMADDGCPNMGAQS